VGTPFDQRFDGSLFIGGSGYGGFKLWPRPTWHSEKNPVLTRGADESPHVHRRLGCDVRAGEDGPWWLTPLFLVVIVARTTDLVSAVVGLNSRGVGLTREIRSVYTSTVLRDLGLRAF